MIHRNSRRRDFNTGTSIRVRLPLHHSKIRDLASDKNGISISPHRRVVLVIQLFPFLHANSCDNRFSDAISLELSSFRAEKNFSYKHRHHRPRAMASSPPSLCVHCLSQSQCASLAEQKVSAQSVYLTVQPFVRTLRCRILCFIAAFCLSLSSLLAAVAR